MVKIQILSSKFLMVGRSGYMYHMQTRVSLSLKLSKRLMELAVCVSSWVHMVLLNLKMGENLIIDD